MLYSECTLDVQYMPVACCISPDVFAKSLRLNKQTVNAVGLNLTATENAPSQQHSNNIQQTVESAEAGGSTASIIRRIDVAV